VGLFQALRARLRSGRPSGTEPFPSGIKSPKHSYLRAIQPWAEILMHHSSGAKDSPNSELP
jgi:hypothetical protein